MKVALHAGQLLQRVPGGIGRYIRGLFVALPGAGVDVVAFAAGDPSVHRSADWPRFVALGHPYAPLRYELWHRLRRPRIRLDVDVVHAPSLAVPPTGRLPLVVTVNDVAFLRYPDLFTRHGVTFHRRGLELARDEARAVIVPSSFTSAELVREGFDPDLLHVAHHGVEVPTPTDDATVALALRRVAVETPYVLTVGTLEPRKNFPLLAQAMARVREHHRSVTLVRVGPPGWGDVPELSGAGVRDLGPVDDATLDALYRGAFACAMPSRYEGFGLPVLEAMARGCPVVASDTSSLPEVVGDAGILVAPDDLDSWVDTLVALLEDREREATLREAGLRRAAQFTWSRSARAHLSAYQAAVGSPARSRSLP
jgi:glycosyltransferase involved in cell wall biosynthesis